MTQNPGPARITIDFHDSLHPARGWILGVGDTPGRVELIAFAPPDGEAGEDGAVVVDLGGCTCPDFCERDHANE